MSFEQEILKNNSIKIGESFLEHAGKKGMKWGRRKATTSFAEDVKQTQKGKGLQRKIEISSDGTKITTSYRDSKRKQVGKDYAEAVINEAARKNRRNTNVAIGVMAGVGALYVARSLIK